MAHLYDEEAALPLVSGWLERSLRAPFLEVMQQEHRRQAVQQTALANVINSCRRLAQIAVAGIFPVDQLGGKRIGGRSRRSLRPPRILRRVIVAGARWRKSPDGQSVRNKKSSTKRWRWRRQPRTKFARHVGYYLIDAGRPALERATGARVPLAERLRRWLRAHAAGAYFGSLFVLAVAMVAAPLLFISGSVPGLTLGLLGLLLLLPASELAVLAVNYLVTSLLPPQVLPKMSFKKEGIPDDCRTLVVVPMLLTTPDAIQSELNRLEIRYLGNTDANLRFALLSRFCRCAAAEHAGGRGVYRHRRPRDRGTESPARSRALLSFSSRALVERERATLDRLGAQARQARATQSIPHRRIRARAGRISLRGRSHCSSRAFDLSSRWMPIPNCCATPPGE